MIKKNWKILLITSIVILLPILAGLILWDQLPEQMPFHWDISGEVDDWVSKPVAVFVMPVVLLAFHWLCMLGTAADPKKAQHQEKVLHLIFWMIPVLSVVLHAFTYATALGGEIPMDVFMSVFLGLIFTIIGNYLPKCKQNYTIGIKIPWTLNSEENWNKTHRFAGRLWVVCGIGMMVSGFVGGFWVFFLIALVMVFAPGIYSYVLHRKGI